MLPSCRNEGDAYSIPQFNLTSRDVVKFADELKTFAGEFGQFFDRSEPRINLYRYMVGLLSTLDRKSIEPIALKVEGAKIRTLQGFISDCEWSDHKMIAKMRSMVSSDLGNQKGALIFDESGFPKKGSESAGVARQYCGILGKVDSCQVGVFSAYASRKGYAFLDKKLYVPEQWFSDEYAVKREKCQFPEDLVFKTKPQLAAEMLHDINQEGTIPFRYITADSIYGDNPDFLAEAESCKDTIYFVGVSSDTQCWLHQPITRNKSYRYGGKLREKEVLERTEKKPITLKVVAESIPTYHWYQRKVSEGTKGPIIYEFYRTRVTIANNGLPARRVWLIVRRTMSSNPEYSFYISNAPENTELSLFVWLSGIRWAIEQAFREANSEVGMKQYEVRKYPGWHHHILVSMMVHFFLWHLKIRLGKKNTSYYYCSDQITD